MNCYKKSMQPYPEDEYPGLWIIGKVFNFYFRCIVRMKSAKTWKMKRFHSNLNGLKRKCLYKGRYFSKSQLDVARNWARFSTAQIPKDRIEGFLVQKQFNLAQELCDGLLANPDLGEPDRVSLLTLRARTFLRRKRFFEARVDLEKANKIESFSEGVATGVMSSSYTCCDLRRSQAKSGCFYSKFCNLYPQR